MLIKYEREKAKGTLMLWLHHFIDNYDSFPYIHDFLVPKLFYHNFDLLSQNDDINLIISTVYTIIVAFIS